MSMPPPGSTRTDTLFPNTSLFRSPWSSLPPYIHHVYTFPPTRKRPGVEPAPSPVLQCPPPIRLRERAMAKTVSQKPTLLSGGNPQIAKGDGDASVQAYIAAIPGWKSAAGRRLDALITRTVPDALKPVARHPPSYRVGGRATGRASCRE